MDQVTGERPLWRRIVDFPLVAMLVAILLYACAAVLAVVIERGLPPMPHNARIAVGVLLNVVLLLAVYKLAIRHLGERPRDDLPARGALRNLGIGLLGGAILFCIVTAAAALAGAYRIVGCCSTGQLIRDLLETAVLASLAEELLFRGILSGRSRNSAAAGLH